MIKFKKLKKEKRENIFIFKRNMSILIDQKSHIFEVFLENLRNIIN